ncbi:MAG TPA: ABC transporter ATP-binding protein [Stellaceae bacterium]|nr:ABC transporter ATP-binding protein [Stellaceae bacterium]
MNRTLWTLAGPIRSYVLQSTVLGLLVTAAYVTQGVLLALALGTIFRAHDVAGALPYVAGLFVLLIARGGLLWLVEIAAQRTAQVTKESLRTRLLEKLVELGPSFALTQQSGKIQQIVVGGVEAIETYYSRYMPTVFVAIFGTALVLAALATIDLRSALVLVPFVVIVPIFSRTWMRWRRGKSRGLFAVRADFGAYLLDSLQGLVTLKAFSATAARRHELVRRAVELRDEAMRTLSVSLIRGGVTGLLSLSGVATLLAWNSWRVASGELPAVALFMTLFLAREAFRPLDRLEREFHSAWNGQTAAPAISGLLDERPLVAEPRRPVPPPARSDIAFERVTFAYPGTKRPALENVSFTVAEHQRVALVGPSGAGKTTVAALLLRFFDPGTGVIRVGGADVRELALADLRKRVALVAQDTFLFHGTIADNLRMAKKDASEEELREAAATAQIDEFIRSLPDGYKTEVGERGAQLSGGQRQRLAIARALLKNAPILILDEATSSVDPASERAIERALERLFEQRTTIVIAHRLSTIRKAHRIFVLNEGALVEHGTHDELLARRGLYTRLTLAQGEAA